MRGRQGFFLCFLRGLLFLFDGRKRKDMQCADVKASPSVSSAASCSCLMGVAIGLMRQWKEREETEGAEKGLLWATFV